MRKIGFVTLLIVLVGIGIYSCNKHEETTSSLYSKSKVDFSDAKLKGGYFDKSVFDVYGIEHNVWMDSIAATTGFSTLYGEDLFDAAQMFNSSIFPSSSLTWIDFQMVESYAMNLLNLAPANAKATLLSDSLFDSSMGTAIETLFDITNTNRSFSDYQEKISDLEEYITDNFNVYYDSTKFEGNAAAFLLGACAIARNSGNYWYDAENSSSSPWHSRISSMAAPNPSDPLPQPRLARWLRAAAKDIGTFVTSEPCIIDDHPTGIYMYDFGCAWREAGNASSQVQ